MEREQRYLRYAIWAVIFVVSLTVGYGIYINEASVVHTEKMMESQYASVTAARAAEREIHATLEGVDITVKTAWKIDAQAQIEGIVTELRAEKGKRVRKGEVLAVIENQEVLSQIAQAEGGVKQAKANLLGAEQELRRYASLAAQDAVSQQQYDDAVAARDVARGQLESAQAQKELYLAQREKEIITAPRDADILRVYCHAGYHIRSGEAVALMGEMSKMYFVANLVDADLKRLSPLEQPFELEIATHLLRYKSYPILALDSTLQLNRFPIRLQQIVPSPEQKTRFRIVTWEIDNRNGILEPTTYQNTRLIARRTRRVLTVPRSAVDDLRRPSVLLIDETGCLRLRKIEIGMYGDSYVEVTAGLQPGDAVVSSGRIGLREGMKVRAEYE